MEILDISLDTIEVYPYWIVPQGGERDAEGKRRILQVELPIHVGKTDFLSKEFDAIIFTSDLQGIAIEDDNEFLLGEKLPEFLATLLTIHFPTINPQKVLIVLCGDLYANLQKRGGLGDVKVVWRSFKQYFRQVVGVAGNHDAFGSKKDFEDFIQEEGITFIQEGIKKVAKLEVGGISGVIGSKDKAFRMPAPEYLAALKKILLKQPDFILLHQSPDFPEKDYWGATQIRELLLQSPKNLVICGHSHWKEPLVRLANGTQVLNVDSRVVILMT